MASSRNENIWLRQVLGRTVRRPISFQWFGSVCSERWRRGVRPCVSVFLLWPRVDASHQQLALSFAGGSRRVAFGVGVQSPPPSTCCTAVLLVCRGPAGRWSLFAHLSTLSSLLCWFFWRRLSQLPVDGFAVGHTRLSANTPPHPCHKEYKNKTARRNTTPGCAVGVYWAKSRRYNVCGYSLRPGISFSHDAREMDSRRPSRPTMSGFFLFSLLFHSFSLSLSLSLGRCLLEFSDQVDPAVFRCCWWRPTRSWATSTLAKSRHFSFCWPVALIRRKYLHRIKPETIYRFFHLVSCVFFASWRWHESRSSGHGFVSVSCAYLMAALTSDSRSWMLALILPVLYKLRSSFYSASTVEYEFSVKGNCSYGPRCLSIRDPPSATA